MKHKLELQIEKENNPYYKDNPVYFDELINLVQENPLSFFNILRNDGISYYSNGKKKYKKYNKEKDRTKLLQWITKHTHKLSDEKYSVSTKCYWILNGLTEFPKCPQCGSDEKFKKMNVSIFTGYRKFCCTRCSTLNHETQSKLKNTCLERYGVDNIRKLKSTIEKDHQTRLIRYGDVGYVNSEKAKYTRYAKNNGKYESDQTRQLRKKLSNERYGTDFPIQNPMFSKKAGETRRNLPNCQKKEIELKKQQTCLMHFGVKHQFMDPGVCEKAKNTRMKKYGVENYTQSDEYKALWKNEKWKNENVKRVQDSKRRNGTFNKSGPEDKAYDLLKFVFPDLIRQYSDNRYPFRCDFYSPAFDLFIEYNGHWTHGGHAFDRTNENDVDVLNKWKTRNTKFYDNAINTWTVRDKLKFETARKNSLNYIVFWNIDEINEFYSVFCSKFEGQSCK